MPVLHLHILQTTLFVPYLLYKIQTRSIQVMLKFFGQNLLHAAVSLNEISRKRKALELPVLYYYWFVHESVRENANLLNEYSNVWFIKQQCFQCNWQNVFSIMALSLFIAQHLSRSYSCFTGCRRTNDNPVLKNGGDVRPVWSVCSEPMLWDEIRACMLRHFFLKSGLHWRERLEMWVDHAGQVL